MKISITICTYKRPVLLREILISLAKQTVDYDNYEVIVCDSHSGGETDDVVSEIKCLHPSLFLYHFHTVNVLAAKRNLGIKKANNEVVVFLDDDCIPDINYVAKHLDNFSNLRPDSKFVFCGEVRFPPELIVKSNYYRFRDEEGFTSLDARARIALNYRTLVVMNMSFLKQPFIELIGGVNENFIGYGMEDQELGWRLELAGYKIIACDAAIIHKEPSTGIEGYGKKIFHTARDGSTTLLSVCPDAFKKMSILKFIDPDYPDLNMGIALCLDFIRFCVFNRFFQKISQAFVNSTDGLKFLYSRKVYRYILACHYLRGARARRTKTVSGLSSDWYS